MNTNIIYRAITVGRDGKLINRESKNITTFIELKAGQLRKKDFVKEVTRVELNYECRHLTGCKTTRVA